MGLLTDYSVSGILPNERITIVTFGIDALIAIGGDNTLGVAFKFHRIGIPVVGVPKLT